ncbi:MAG TPA: hypothetical protein VF955_04565 [Pyrinomonadaceae bacterium]
MSLLADAPGLASPLHPFWLTSQAMDLISQTTLEEYLSISTETTHPRDYHGRLQAVTMLGLSWTETEMA